jgi:hypothetical protein
MQKKLTNITNTNDTVANALLCAFGETVCTPAGRIEPREDGMILNIEGRRPRTFKTASGALEVLRRATS